MATHGEAVRLFREFLTARTRLLSLERRVGAAPANERPELERRAAKRRVEVEARYPIILNLLAAVGLTVPGGAGPLHPSAGQTARRALEIYQQREAQEPAQPIESAELPVVQGDVRPITSPQPSAADEANRYRKLLGTFTLIASALFALTAIVWTVCAMKDLRKDLLDAKGMTFGLGLVLIGKTLMTVVLLAAAYTSVRTTEKLTLPINSWLESMQLATAAKGQESNKRVGELLAEVLDALKNRLK